MMHLSKPAAVVAAICLGAISMTAASVSYAAAPLPVPGNAAAIPAPAFGAAIAPILPLEPAVFTSEMPVEQGKIPAIDPQVPSASLAALVDRNAQDLGNMDDQTRCLATAIFYEARSESLAGKLAVARVVINRAASGRFRPTVCGVVAQPGQFSFVRGGQIPNVSGGGAQWADSVAVARVAKADSWKSQVEGALYFHARRVAPSWNRQRMASVDNHIFYR